MAAELNAIRTALESGDHAWHKSCPFLEATTAVREQWVHAARQTGSMAAAPRKLSQAAQGGTVVAGARRMGAQPSAHSRQPKDKVMCGDGGWQRRPTSPSNPHDCTNSKENLHKPKMQSSQSKSPVHWERFQEPAVEDKA